jgi:carbon-monoxide dehydrogenase small subunit
MMSRLILVLLIYGSTEANIMDVTVTLTVNGIERTITTNPARPLLDVLREELHLTGAKYGCGEGRCGACTVLMDGRRTLSCVTPVSMADKKTITTIEGLADGDSLHPVQQAFLDEGAIQCGYCTPGMILSTVALLNNNPQPTDEQIAEWMNGNLCRCNGYTKILNAIRRAAAQIAEVKIA